MHANREASQVRFAHPLWSISQRRRWQATPVVAGSGQKVDAEMLKLKSGCTAATTEPLGLHSARVFTSGTDFAMDPCEASCQSNRACPSVRLPDWR